MTRFEEALKIVSANTVLCGVEKVDILQSTGRVLREDIFSDMNMPPFNRSAVDGFACRKEDLEKELIVIETIRAGQAPTLPIASGQCTRIMTGSPVPEGADCVIMVEETVEIVDNRIRFTGKTTKTNISRFAEDVREGDLVLSSGTIIRPQHIAILAAVGCVIPKVTVQPRVAVIATGDEIVEPHIKPGISQIRNSNGYQLVEQVRKAGAIPEYMGIAADNEKDTLSKILDALSRNDVIILTGGISMGTYDFVPAVMEKAGIDILFRTLMLQPGRPTIFGLKGDKRIFGLPGNPVSSFTIFEILAKPMLWKMMGVKEYVSSLKMPIGTDYQRKRSDRMQWLPVQIRDGKVFPVEYHGSAHIFALAQADALAAIPLGITQLSVGELIDVRQI
jgi:molybdopterin molybdotransferase